MANRSRTRAAPRYRPRSVIRFELTDDELSHTRLAISPLWELVSSLCLLHKPDPGIEHAVWIARTRRVLRGVALGPLEDPFGGSRLIPDFIAPIPDEPLPSLDRSTLRERALQSIRRAITSGQYRPGDHLGEVELASRLGISRGTVREALRHLQQEGLVRPGARGMLSVNSLTSHEIRGLYQVRSALEGLAVATIIRSARRDQALETLRAALAQLSSGDGLAERVEADLGFHLLLCQLADNPMLVEAWRNLEGRIRVAIMSHDAEQLPEIMAGNRHAPIVDAIEQGDIPAALAVVEQHMAAAADLYASA